MISIKNIVLIFITTLPCLFYATKQLPIVLVHGILADTHDMEPTKNYLSKYMPDVYVKNIKLGQGVATSFFNMHYLSAQFKSEVEQDPNLADGFIVIAHSQGGLVARHYLQHYNSPKIHTYISWGTPHQGVFGTPGTFDNKLVWINMFNWLEERASSILYSGFFQNYISFASYWHDPLNTSMYLEYCSFLPYLNNEKEHPFMNTYKNNICSLDAMVLVNSTEEDIIEPAVSCHFGFYKKGSHELTESMHEWEIYINDNLGLRTLAEAGKLHFKTAHCTHTNYQEDEENFVTNTLPYLQAATA